MEAHVHSMTGLGQAARENERFRISVTVRSVNHRYLDIVLRLREEYRGLEPRLRERIASRLQRGRVEAAFEIEALGPRPVGLTVDEEIVRRTRGTVDRLAAEGWIGSELHFTDILRIPEAVRFQVSALEWQAGDRELLDETLDLGLERLLEARATEGAKLRTVLVEQLAVLRAVTTALRERAAAVPAEVAASLERRVRELLADRLPEDDRLAQEAALLADRSDVREELDRLASHIQHFEALLDRPESIGKQLDFLAQEIFRELNTTAAKCRDSEMLRQVLEGKTACERLREQIQNIE